MFIKKKRSIDFVFFFFFFFLLNSISLDTVNRSSLCSIVKSVPTFHGGRRCSSVNRVFTLCGMMMFYGDPEWLPST